ncbi:stalk domain-containing protein [Gorillibacterium sp. sgz5001074]|uniref:stalk domain-containing protein n=1 Tax=Gorillibacterium sp. sgz5001074 TaxID=3446695 RepID=UPI003F67384A
MKKYVIGFLAGCAFMTMATAFADDVQSIIGKTVEMTYPVSVNGESLNVPAAVIGDSAYLPVRAVSEAIGLNVGFDEKTGIALTEKEAKPVDVTPTPSATATPKITPVPTQTPTPTASGSQTTYKGHRAYVIDGETYYSYQDYWAANGRTNGYKLIDGVITIKKKDGTEYKISENDRSAVQIIDGQTYFNIKYYPE